MRKQKINRMAGFAVLTIVATAVLLAGCKDIVRSLGIEKPDYAKVTAARVTNEALITGIALKLTDCKAEDLYVKVPSDAPFTASIATDSNGAKIVFNLTSMPSSDYTGTIDVYKNGVSKKKASVNVTVKADAYRHFTDKNGKNYEFWLVSQEHFKGTSAPSGFSQGSGGANATVDFSTDHLAVFSITQTGKGQTGNSLHITGAPSSYDYMEFKFKDFGDAGITIRIDGKEWVYRDGKFKFFATIGSNYNATQITGEDKVIKTTYNKSNNNDVVFGIWNGATGSDAETSLFMECAGGFDKDKAQCHFVYDNSGTETFGSIIDFIVQPSGDTSNKDQNKVELDYISFYKKQ